MKKLLVTLFISTLIAAPAVQSEALENTKNESQPQINTSISTTNSEIEKTEKETAQISLPDESKEHTAQITAFSKDDADELLTEVTSTMNSKNATMSKKIGDLEALIVSQKERIQTLEAKISNTKDNGMTFAVWAGILLAAVAALVTTLGVGMAIFSFFGYKKIMTSAQDVATHKATAVATQVATDKTPETTKEVLITLVENGNFNQVIHEAVEKVTYRGIQLSGQEELDGDTQ